MKEGDGVRKMKKERDNERGGTLRVMAPSSPSLASSVSLEGEARPPRFECCDLDGFLERPRSDFCEADSRSSDSDKEPSSEATSGFDLPERGESEGVVVFEGSKMNQLGLGLGLG